MPKKYDQVRIELLPQPKAPRRPSLDATVHDQEDRRRIRQLELPRVSHGNRYYWQDDEQGGYA